MSQSAVRDLAYIAVFAALIIVFAFVAIPVGGAGVPIVLQNAIVILTGLILGAKRGIAATLLFLLVGLLGFPVMAGGRQLLPALAGPTAGYIVGYVFSAACAGALAYWAMASKSGQIIKLALAGAAGLLIQYACGVVGLVIVASMPFAKATLAQLPFIGPDALKVAIMVSIAYGVHRAIPGLIRK